MTATQLTNNSNEPYVQDFFILNDSYAVGEDACIYQIVNKEDLQSEVLAYESEDGTGTVFNYAEDGGIDTWGDHEDCVKYWKAKGSKVEFESLSDQRTALELANNHVEGIGEYVAENVGLHFVFLVTDNDELVEAIYGIAQDGSLDF